MKKSLIASAVAVSLLGIACIPAVANAAPRTVRAASTVAITFEYNMDTHAYVPVPADPTATVGDTITVTNPMSELGGSYIAVVNGKGTASLNGTSCETINDCKVLDDFPNNPSMNVVATTAGTLRLIRVNVFESTTTRLGTVTVSPAPTPPVERSISITGERGVVSGKSGVIVTGTSVGFRNGAQFTAHVKFPGQTDYTEASQKATTDTNGDFTWSRKTGKKTYVYFSSANGEVRSSRIIIPAQ